MTCSLFVDVGLRLQVRDDALASKLIEASETDDNRKCVAALIEVMQQMPISDICLGGIEIDTGPLE